MNRMPRGRLALRTLSCAGVTTLLLTSCGGGSEAPVADSAETSTQAAHLSTLNFNPNASINAMSKKIGSIAPKPTTEPTTTPTTAPVSSTDTVPVSSTAPATDTTSTAPATDSSASSDTTATSSLLSSTTPSTAGSITYIKVQNTAATEQRNVPITFGQVFAQGALVSTDGLAGRLSDGSTMPMQMEVKAKHADGSVRHAIISAVVPALASGQTRTVELVKASAGAKTGAAPTTLTNAGFTASVSVNLGGQTYTASADTLLKSGKFTTWLAGPVANEWLVSAPLKTSQGVEHPHLNARFAIRSYGALNKARVDVTVENNWTYEPSPQNFTYDAQVTVGGQTVFSQTALKHFHHARWRKSFWWGGAPQVEVQHDPKYLIGSKALPNYDTSLAISATALSGLDGRWTKSNTAPMGPGVVLPAMPTTGGRGDIGPLPEWGSMYLLSMDNRAKKVTLGVGDLAGSWPIHYRDKKTDLPVSLANYPYMTLLGRSGDAYNPVTKQSESFPACGGDCSTIYQPDASHQPSMAYLPYIVTGDYYYLEELQFWANYNMIMPNSYYRGLEKGLLKADQVRGQAWSLRTLGQVAYITPDNHPMKSYFVDRVGYNLDWYNTTYSSGNPNPLGVIDGSGQYAGGAVIYTTASGVKTGVAPWQDDFFTWSAGYLVELGFAKAQPLLNWKAKFPIQRMIGSGYCWIDGATYALAIRPSATSPAYATIGEAYRANMRKADGTALVNSTGARYLDQACGSQAMANWRTQYDRDRAINRSAWVAGEMDGYATATSGYPSNMQPALAVAATSGAANGRAAWDLFIRRPVKPDYTTAPQWAVVPRN